MRENSAKKPVAHMQLALDGSEERRKQGMTSRGSSCQISERSNLKNIAAAMVLLGNEREGD